MFFKKTYEVMENAPPPMDWSEYKNYIVREYDLLLTTKGDDEKAFQHFFERNPSFLPGAFGLLGQSGHYPIHGTVISQPQLMGLRTRVPDFMWLATNSGFLYPVMIEIEAPNKKWYVKSGKPSEDLAQALDQLAEWKTWFDNPAHKMLFFDYYQIPSGHRDKAFHPLYVLIYGRREEFDGEPHLNEKRSKLARQDEFLMTYDRLHPDINTDDMLCSVVRDSKIYAKAIPPTLKLGPNLAEYHSLIHGKEEAALQCKLISDLRRDFIVNRLKYWDEYGRKKEKGLIHSGDCE